MPEQYLNADQLMLFKIQAAAGTEETPTPAADAIKVSDLRFTTNFGVDPADDEHTGSLDRGEPVVSGGNGQMSFGVRLKGSGVAATPAEWGRCLLGCGFAENVQAAAETGTAQAGAPTSITLAAGAGGGGDNQFAGMRIDITSGTGSGQYNYILSYDDTSKIATVAQTWATDPDATSQYDIPAGVQYAPISTDLDLATLWAYQNANQAAVNSWRRRIFDAMGSFTAEIGAGQTPRAAFNYTGVMPAVPDNQARPSGVAFDATVAQAFRGADAWLGGSPLKFQTLSFDEGAVVATPQDPAQAFGADRASITARNINGRLVPYLKLSSQFDFIDDFINQNAASFVAAWGATAGDRVAITLPSIRYNGNIDEQNIEGFAAQGAPFKSVGADTGLYIVTY